MSISDKEVTASAAAATTAADDAALAALFDEAGRSPDHSPYRTITDQELTLVQICCDFVCACIALPLSLILLSEISAVRVNALGRVVTNSQIDSLFPVAV